MGYKCLELGYGEGMAMAPLAPSESTLTVDIDFNCLMSHQAEQIYRLSPAGLDCHLDGVPVGFSTRGPSVK